MKKNKTEQIPQTINNYYQIDNAHVPASQLVTKEDLSDAMQGEFKKIFDNFEVVEDPNQNFEVLDYDELKEQIKQEVLKELTRKRTTLKDLGDGTTKIRHGKFINDASSSFGFVDGKDPNEITEEVLRELVQKELLKSKPLLDEIKEVLNEDEEEDDVKFVFQYEDGTQVDATLIEDSEVEETPQEEVCKTSEKVEEKPNESTEEVKEEINEEEKESASSISEQDILSLIKEELKKAIIELKSENLANESSKVSEKPIVEDKKTNELIKKEENVVYSEPILNTKEVYRNIPLNETRGKEKEIVRKESENESFAKKVISSNKIIKSQYQELKDLLLSYGLNSRIGNSGEAFRLHRKTYAKISTTGTGLKICLALDPKTYSNSSIPIIDLSKKDAYKDIPLGFRINSDLSMKRARELVQRCLLENNLKKDEDYISKNHLRTLKLLCK